MMKWEKFSEEQLQKFVQKSNSFAELKRKIRYADSRGSSLPSLKKMIEKYQFDIGHFTGQGWNQNNFDYSRFRKGNAVKSADAVKALSYKRGRKCECCGLTEWQRQEIPLQVHHLDGDRLNNEEENLQLLCPNCHALTDNYCGKNIQEKAKEVSDEDFVSALIKAPNIRQALLNLGLTPKRGNYVRAKELAVKNNVSHILS